MFNAYTLVHLPTTLPYSSSPPSPIYSRQQHLLQRTEPECYFSFVPNPSDHYSIETPLASPEGFYDPPTPLSDPANPLLSLRPTSALLTHYIPMEASKFMQFQTEAAHGRRSGRQRIASPSEGTLLAAAMFSDALPPTPPQSERSMPRSDSDASDSSMTSTSSSGSATSMSDTTNSATSPSRCSRCQSISTSTSLSAAPYCSSCARLLSFGS